MGTCAQFTCQSRGSGQTSRYLQTSSTFQVLTCGQGLGIQNDGSELLLHIGITGKLSQVPTSSSSAFGSWGGERWAWCFSEVPYDSHMKPKLRPTDAEELESQSLASRTLEMKVSLPWSLLILPSSGSQSCHQLHTGSWPPTMRTTPSCTPVPQSSGFFTWIMFGSWEETLISLQKQWPISKISWPLITLKLRKWRSQIRWTVPSTCNQALKGAAFTPCSFSCFAFPYTNPHKDKPNHQSKLSHLPEGKHGSRS